jgi:hypothetical protein
MEPVSNTASPRRQLLLAMLAASACSAVPLSAKALPSADGGETASTPAASMKSWRLKSGPLITRTWGIDIVGVHPVSSGFMLAFKYKILDPSKAKLLNERKQKAYLVDEATGTVLAVPAMENIGELRAATTPQVDRTYFMIFGNPGRLVKPGARVSVVAGDFKIQGLVVE